MKQQVQDLPREAFLRQRWDRIGLGVRLAYNPWYPGVIRCYLQAGALLARAGVLPELPVQQRMLQVLLQAAGDPGLPWAWRSACHEHMVFPLARLATLARLGLGPAATPWQQRVDACAQLLDRCRPGACDPQRPS